LGYGRVGTSFAAKANDAEAKLSKNKKEKTEILLTKLIATSFILNH
jgi:hypothetical protein